MSDLDLVDNYLDTSKPLCNLAYKIMKKKVMNIDIVDNIRKIYYLNAWKKKYRFEDLLRFLKLK